MKYLKIKSKILLFNIFLINCITPCLGINPGKISYSKDYIFLGNNNPDIITPLSIQTTVGPIRIDKAQGKIKSEKRSITSGGYIKLEGKGSTIAAAQNISSRDILSIDANNCSTTASTGALTATSDITIASNGAGSTITAGSITSNGALTIAPNSCLIRATSDGITVANGISILGNNNIISATKNITFAGSMSITGQNSSIFSSTGTIEATAPRSSISALGSGSIISAATLGTGIIRATTIVANTINAQLLITPSSNISNNAPILKATTAQGTITADIIYADNVYATTANISKTQPANLIDLIYTAQQIVLNLLSRN